MAVSIRFKRGGKKKYPYYWIVATDSRNPRDGKFLEKLGTYNPNPEIAQVTLKKERFDHWVENGAQVSPAVASAVKLVK